MDTDKSSAWRNLSQTFLKLHKKVYIRDFNKDYYFAEIISVSEDSIKIKAFGPSSRVGKTFDIYYPSIERYEEWVKERVRE